MEASVGARPRSGERQAPLLADLSSRLNDLMRRSSLPRGDPPNAWSSCACLPGAWATPSEQLGRVEDAAVLSPGACLDRDDYAARYHLAVALDRTGRREEAIPEYRETIAYAPTTAGPTTTWACSSSRRAEGISRLARSEMPG